MALQHEIELQGGETVQLAFLTAAAASRAACWPRSIVIKRGRPSSTPSVSHGRAPKLELRQSTLSTVELERFQALLSALLYPYHGLRAEPSLLAANTRGQPGLLGLRYFG